MVGVRDRSWLRISGFGFRVRVEGFGFGVGGFSFPSFGFLAAEISFLSLGWFRGRGGTIWRPSGCAARARTLEVELSANAMRLFDPRSKIEMVPGAPFRPGVGCLIQF